MPLLQKRPENPVTHRVSYYTDIIESWNGLENRIAILGAPRDSWDLEYALISDQEVRQFRARLFNDSETTWTLPVWPEGLLVTAAISGFTVQVNNTYSDWAAAAGPVYLENQHGDYYTANIVSVAGGPGVVTLTLDVVPPGGTTWGANLAEIFPLATVQLAEGTSLARYPMNAGKVNVTATRTTFRSVFGTGATIVTHDGLPVLVRDVVIHETSPEQFNQMYEVVDYGAKFTAEASRTTPILRREQGLTIQNAADRQYVTKFLQTVLGRQGAFLLATWAPDLQVSVQPTTTTLRVKKPPQYPDAVDYLVDWFPSLAHRRIQLRMTDGSVLYRTISAAVDNGDGTESLTMNAAVDTTGAAPDVAMVSLLETVRLADDVIAISYVNARGGLSLPVVVVQR